MVIVYTATRNYYPYLKTTIKSLYAHNNPYIPRAEYLAKYL